MNVKQINELLAGGVIDREEMWPRIMEYEAKAAPFLFEFGLDALPTAPGLISVRGPRQYGKSTWLDLELRQTIQDFGAGSAYYLNGDEIGSEQELYELVVALSKSFAKTASVRRLFIDEITAVDGWENALKRAYDEGATRKILLVTTGSRATDLMRGMERLPGRKGKLKRSNYLFLPISYKQFLENTGLNKDSQSKPWVTYLLSGGVPLAANDLYQFERLPEYFRFYRRYMLVGVRRLASPR